MELGQSARPRATVAEFNDFQQRKKCSFCCAVRSSLYAGGVLFAISFPCNSVMLGVRHVCEGRGLLGFLNRHLFLALPFSAVTFTHQWMVSESLWSKHRKTVYDINVQTTIGNILLWGLLIGGGTFVSRRVLPSRSRTYRLTLWEYQRSRRSCANKYFPSMFGRMTEDLDWYNLMWTLSVYHILWGMAAVLLEKEMGAQYAMFYRDSAYSAACSPRWREWREVEVSRHVHKSQSIAPDRWGTFLTHDKWRTRSD